MIRISQTVQDFRVEDYRGNEEGVLSLRHQYHGRELNDMFQSYLSDHRIPIA